MSAFTQTFDVQQSADGKTGTVTDTSNYAGSDQGYTPADFTRTVTIRNALGVTVQTFVLDGLTKTFSLTADLWTDAVISWQGKGAFENVLLEKNLVFPLARITQNMFLRELAENGCCGSKKSQEAMINADLFFTGMEFTAPAGEGIRWQSYSNTAYRFLDTLS